MSLEIAPDEHSALCVGERQTEAERKKARKSKEES